MLDEINERQELNPVPTRWWQRTWAHWLIIWAIGTFVGLVFTLQYYFTSFRSERPVPFFDSAYMQMSWSYLWALATPIVLWTAARLPLERRNWVRMTLLHVPVSVLLSVTLTAIGHVVLWVNYGWRMGKPFSWERLARFVVANFSEGIGIYLLIVLSYYAFNYYQRYRRGELKTLQLEAQLSQAQLEALKMQLHPHFLFNTLHSISALLNKDVEAARSMIARLGDFLRLTLENAGNQEVTLQQEIEFLNRYLEIERIRFQDRLTTLVEVDPSVLDVKVPNLILQPLVENAMRHAIANSDCGRIEVLAAPNNGMLRIQVKDNGPGLQVVR